MRKQAKYNKDMSEGKLKETEDSIKDHRLESKRTKDETKPRGPSLDLGPLQKVLGSQSNKLREIIDIFVEEVPENVTAIKWYYLSGQLDKLKLLLHKTKSRFAYLGFKDIYSLCHEMERELRDGIEKDYLAQIGKIEQATNAAVNLLTDYYA